MRCVNAALSTSAGDRDQTKYLSAHKIVVQPNQAFSLQVHPQLLNRSANTATEFCRIFCIVALTQRCGVGCFCMMSICKTVVMAAPGAQTASATIAVMCTACVLNTASSQCWLSTVVVLPRIVSDEVRTRKTFFDRARILSNFRSTILQIVIHAALSHLDIATFLVDAFSQRWCRSCKVIRIGDCSPRSQEPQQLASFPDVFAV